MVKEFIIGKTYTNIDLDNHNKLNNENIIADPDFIVKKIKEKFIYVKYLDNHNYMCNIGVDCDTSLVRWDIDFIEKYVEIKKETNDKN